MPNGVICGGAVEGSNQAGEIVTCHAMVTRPDGRLGGGGKRYESDERGEQETIRSKVMRDYPKRWQATRRPSTSASFGSSRAQRAMACGQRGWKRQPDGGFSGLGTSPGRMISSRRSSGWLGSAAENSASV